MELISIIVIIVVGVILLDKFREALRKIKNTIKRMNFFGGSEKTTYVSPYTKRVSVKGHYKRKPKKKKR